MKQDGIDNFYERRDCLFRNLVGNFLKTVMPQVEKFLDWRVLRSRRRRNLLFKIDLIGDKISQVREDFKRQRFKGVNLPFN
ncbi:unnamed protein product [Cochlearia groenlandica]